MLQTATINISLELWGAIICLIFAAIIMIGEVRNTKSSRIMIILLLFMFILLISDSAANIYRGVPGRIAYYAVRISNYLVFAINYAIGFCFMLYLDSILETYQLKLNHILRLYITSICLIGFTLVTFSQFTGFLYIIDEHNIYHRASHYIIIVVVGMLLVLSMIGTAAHYYHKVHIPQAMPLLIAFVLVLLGTLVQTLIYGLSLANIGMAVGVVVMFFSYEKRRIAVSSERREKLLENELNLALQQTELAQKDAEMANIKTKLMEEQTQLMLSQIQPHFIYNALSAISFLCIKDPVKAKETIDNFSIYLRTNLNSLKTEHLVPFDQELLHVKAYLAIEQTRFGDDLNIQFDIGYTDFMLPSLSLQPLAENAVRHGICGKEDGGTVTIRTETKDDRIYITVLDDGIGFDTSTKPNDGKVHVGMENVAQRVQALSNGEVIIDSTPGVGTTATIILPATAKIQ